MIEPVDFSNHCNRDAECKHALIVRVVVISMVVALVSALFISLLVVRRRVMRRRALAESASRGGEQFGMREG